MLPYSGTEIPECRTDLLMVDSTLEREPFLSELQNATEVEYPIDVPSRMAVKGVNNWFPSSF
jgi:hypothetical protein